MQMALTGYVVCGILVVVAMIEQWWYERNKMNDTGTCRWVVLCRVIRAEQNLPALTTYKWQNWDNDTICKQVPKKVLASYIVEDLGCWVPESDARTIYALEHGTELFDQGFQIAGLFQKDPRDETSGYIFTDKGIWHRQQ